MTSFFKIGGREMPWGDYGDILLKGMTCHRGRNRDGVLQLERTGPFIPPVSFSGINDVLVTDDFKKELSKSPFTGLIFKEVIKLHIVRVDWQNWDFAATDPEFYPEEGEPEGYILDEEHDPVLADNMGAIWEAVLPFGAERILTNSVNSKYVVAEHIDRSSWQGSHFFKTRFVTDAGKAWFERSTAKDWISFKEIVAQ